MLLSRRNLSGNIFIIRLVFFMLLILFACGIQAQQITGVWKGKIDKKKVELKIVQNGDSLTGTSYYYESASNYRRYSIKGYFDQQTNSAVWWDDRLIEEKAGKNIFGTPGKTPLLSVADFNCPGGGEMHLEGNAALKENKEDIKGPVDLTKIDMPIFKDEWDFVIDNYTVGSNDPYIIDSISAIAYHPAPVQPKTIMEEKPAVILPVKKTETPAAKKETALIPAPEKKITTPALTIQEKFTSRSKIFTAEIPVEGDSIELRFYDNAEIDGDSISLFLDGKLIFEHIRLSDKAYTIRLPAAELGSSSELIMVAENLGSIPPNTSYMVAIVGEKRYEAKLASTENSSAMIRLKPIPNPSRREGLPAAQHQ